MDASILGQDWCGRCCGISLPIWLTLSSEVLMEAGIISSGASGMS
jgi:hypothetical protein